MLSDSVVVVVVVCELQVDLGVVAGNGIEGVDMATSSRFLV